MGWCWLKNGLMVAAKDAQVRASKWIFVAGINRCDWVAEGVIQAVQKLKPEVPVVVRLSGTNVEAGQAIINNSELGILSADTLDQAAEVVVNAIKT